VSAILSLVGRAGNATVRLLLAPACVACAQVLARPLEGPVCAECWLRIPRLTPPLCARCGDALPPWRASSPLCPRCRRMPGRTAARSAGLYDGPLRPILHAFKYDDRRLLARPLARLMADVGADWLEDADAVIPVPLHPWRALTRGFNQADDLAGQLGPPVWRALDRRRAGPPQAGLPVARRHANVRGAFALAVWSRPVLGPSWGRRLEGRRVVLVDDVMTTGATLEACAGVLRRAGVSSVRALTVARAVAARPAPPPRSPHPSEVPHR
jgi:ComF family protein